MNRHFLQLKEAMQNTRADYNMLWGGGLHRTEGVSLLIALSFSFTGGEEGLEFLRRKSLEIHSSVAVLSRYRTNVCMSTFVPKICPGLSMSRHNGLVTNLNIKQRTLAAVRYKGFRNHT